MKTINEKFTDEEHSKMKKLKGKKLSWHDFFLLLADHAQEAIKKGDLEIFKT